MPGVRAYVGVGTNVGERADHLRRALGDLAAGAGALAAVSAVWETEPVDAPSPAWFWNMAVALDWSGSPAGLLDRLLGIERRAGRTRSVRGAPRTLDLDLLLVGHAIVDHPRLALPHPRMWIRRFVLAPLAEIAPDARDPQSGRTVAEALAGLCDPARVRRLGPLATLAPVPLYSPTSQGSGPAA
jgi:2-amino-4-hydroxy-6-hydroxymethyldihydropteridine diphosphokinase